MATKKPINHPKIYLEKKILPELRFVVLGVSR
jgi:hypothetical protein